MYNKGGDLYRLGGRLVGPRRLSARPWPGLCAGFGPGASLVHFAPVYAAFCSELS